MLLLVGQGIWNKCRVAEKSVVTRFCCGEWKAAGVRVGGSVNVWHNVVIEEDEGVYIGLLKAANFRYTTSTSAVVDVVLSWAGSE